MQQFKKYLILLFYLIPVGIFIFLIINYSEYDYKIRFRSILLFIGIFWSLSYDLKILFGKNIYPFNIDKVKRLYIVILKILSLFLFLIFLIFLNLINKNPIEETMLTVFAILTGILGIIAIIQTLTISIKAIKNPYSINVFELNIPIINLKNEIKIVHLSDIYIGEKRGDKYFTKIVEEINKQSPDIILIIGDIIDRRSKINRLAFSKLKQLSAPIFYVLGNYDKFVGVNKVIKLLEENKVKILKNEVFNNNEIQLIGLNFMIEDEKNYDLDNSNKKTVKYVLSNIEISLDKTSILIQLGTNGIKYIKKKELIPSYADIHMQINYSRKSRQEILYSQ